MAPGTGEAAPRRRCTSASTTGWSPGGAARRADLPAVLRRLRRWPRCGWRTRRSSTPPTPRSCAGSPRARSTACGSTTRTGCATRAATCAGCARRSGRTRWLVVEKILGSGEALPASWPVDGTTGLRGAARDPAACSSTRTARALRHPVRRRAHRRRESLHAAEHAARREVADTILAAEVRRIAALALGRRRRRDGRATAVAELLLRASRSTGPTCRRAARRWTRRAVGGRAPAGPTSPTRSTRIDAAMLRRPARRARHPVPADLGHGDGQGRRGHRVLPVEPVRRAQRGRRRPGPLRGVARRVPRRARRPGGRPARRP